MQEVENLAFEVHLSISRFEGSFKVSKCMTPPWPRERRSECNAKSTVSVKICNKAFLIDNLREDFELDSGDSSR